MIWAPMDPSWSGVRPLTVAWVPTGMKMGVSTGPCDVCSRPRRAAPSVASSSKWNGIRHEPCLAAVRRTARPFEPRLNPPSIVPQPQVVLLQLVLDLLQRRLPEVLRLQQLLGAALDQVAQGVDPQPVHAL